MERERESMCFCAKKGEAKKKYPNNIVSEYGHYGPIYIYRKEDCINITIRTFWDFKISNEEYTCLQH